MHPNPYVASRLVQQHQRDLLAQASRRNPRGTRRFPRLIKPVLAAAAIGAAVAVAASGCGTGSTSGGSPDGPPTSKAPPTSQAPPASGTATLTQWAQQYAGDVTALLDAANYDMTQISTNICNSNNAYCVVPDCSDTTAAANQLQSDPQAPDAGIASYISTGAQQLAMAAGNCAGVGDFIPGYGNIGKAAQALGLSPTG